MSTHPLIDLWHSFRDAPRPDPATTPIPDYFRQGIDYLSWASDAEFESFMRDQLSSEELRAKLGFSTVVEWLTAASSNNPSSTSRVRDWGLYDFIRFPVFIDRLRIAIWSSIANVIVNAYADGSLPESGMVLYFTDQLTYCYLIHYHLHYDRPVIEILDRIASPRGVLEIERINALRNHRSRNNAKSYLTSGHKVIIQRGVLTHVDRRLDRNVFGPTIDTLILSDVLARSSFLSETRNVLEIGSGNGHISSTLAALCPRLEELYTIDINEFAVACTTRNIRNNVRYFHPGESGKARLKHVYSTCGRYRNELFQNKFDLVVSNPPYIEKPSGDTESFAERFPEAVGGTELMREILTSLPDVLTPNGRLLIMTSSASGDISRLLPEGFTHTAASSSGTGMRVPFDVEEVLDQPSWLQSLEKNGNVARDGDSFTHVATPVWIERK